MSTVKAQVSGRGFIALALIILSTSLYTKACSYRSTHTERGIVSEQTDYPDEVSIDSLLHTMTLSEKIGQLFFIRARGYFKNTADEDYRRLLSRINDFHIGGLVFFKGTVYGQAVLTNALQRQSEIPLWVTQDMEFGAAMRVERTTRITPAMGIAATQNPHFAYLAGKITAQEAKALGVHQVFAPVIDVNNNPRNPVINVRSFSSNTDTVARYGLQFMEGVLSEGIIPTAKHFPGHGDTNTDSHRALPVIPYDYTRLDTLELVPFKAVIEAGIPSIMSAHLAFPKISKNPGLPGTLDRSILHRILKDSLGFDGLVVTDGLEMRGISAHYSPGKAVVMALKAGADMMLLSLDEITAIHEVRRAVERGTISEERINQSVRKILSHKRKAGLFQDASVSISALSSQIGSHKNEAIADEISRKSIVLLKNEDQILPIRSSKYHHVLVLSITDTDNDEKGNALAHTMRRYHPNIRHRVFHRKTSAEERRNILQNARWADLIVIDSHIGIRSSGSYQFTSSQRRLFSQLPGQTPKALITLGNPYAVTDMPGAEVQLIGWDEADHQLKNIAPALFGASAISGRLPIEIPGSYELGAGLSLPKTTIRYDHPEAAGLSIDSLQNIDATMREAIFDSTFPGGVVTVLKDGIIAYQKGFGYETYKKHQPIRASAIYDLASLTKVMATTPAIMKLVAEGKISLDDKVGDYFPEYRKGKKSEITIANLLRHDSGLPPFRIYVDHLKTRSAIVEAIKNEPLVNEPGTTYKYSDLGFILLGEIVKRVTGLRIDDYMRQTFYTPMGMNSTYFNPKKVGKWISNRIPPTERDTIYRHKLMQAQVHDERAYYMNGVAGHAGLFSSGSDIAAYAQLLLNKGGYGGKQYISPSVVEKFSRRQSELVNRGYGFDRKSKGFSTAGSLTSDQTFGHTGFTGTSLWIDPKRNMAIIILTNRVYPYRSYGKNISQIRANVADAAVSSIKPLDYGY